MVLHVSHSKTSAVPYQAWRAGYWPILYEHMSGCLSQYRLKAQAMTSIKRCGSEKYRSIQAVVFLSLAVFFAICLSGCSSTAGNVALGVAGTTLIGARSPGQELEQIYYLGVFDPQEQLPAMVYRVRVRGQASVLSGMKFGSGWVPAIVIDSLGTGISFSEEDGVPRMTKAGEDPLKSIQTGRRLILFGPEGFREAPKDHRLVIVMGASPEKWFNAVDRSLGAVSDTLAEQRNEGLEKLVLSALSDAQNEETRMDDLIKDVKSDLRSTEGDAQ